MSTDKLSQNGLIAPEDLYYLLGGHTPIRILDASYSVSGGYESPQQAFLSSHIDSAQFFDIDTVADQDAPLPHTLPSPEYFTSCVESMGISSEDHVVIYDQSGAYMASSRAWWMFRVFGHDKAYVLDGGLQNWMACGFKTVSGPANIPVTGSFKASYRKDLVATKDDLLENIQSSERTVLDARPPLRFMGRAPEPRPGMRAGHIPGSINVPFPDVLQRDRTKQDGGHNVIVLKDNSMLEDAFQTMGLSSHQKTAISCGSGVTACTVALALYKARGHESAIYDGSWSEWGAEDAGTPVEQNA
jgi:thiosulfate/3-mercaptopyruvate sulfurtransferase